MRTAVSRRGGTLGAWVELLHPMPIIGVLLLATGAASAAHGDIPPADRLAPFLLSIALTQVSISLHNDYCDRELDARAKPWRAIPRGLVTPGAALLAAAGLFALGLLAALLLGAEVAALVAVGTSLAFVYNRYLKRTPLAWVPLGLALPTLVVCAFVVVGRFDERLLVAYALGGPFALAVYLADSLDDVARDSRAGVRGLNVLLGQKGALLGCWLSLGIGLAISLALWPAALPPGPLYYTAVALLGLAAAFGRIHWRLHWSAIVGSGICVALGWLQALTG